MKISEDRRERFKRWAKNTTAVAAGTAAGTGLGMVAERALSKRFGPKVRGLPQDKKLKLLGAAIGATTIGSYIASRHLQKKLRRREES